MEAHKAIIDFDEFDLKDRIKFLFTGKLGIKIEPDEEIDGYEVFVRFGSFPGDKLPRNMSSIQDALDF